MDENETLIFIKLSAAEYLQRAGNILAESPPTDQCDTIFKLCLDGVAHAHYLFTILNLVKDGFSDIDDRQARDTAVFFIEKEIQEFRKLADDIQLNDLNRVKQNLIEQHKSHVNKPVH